MLHYAVVFFVIALIAALFGFGGIAAGAAEIAKVLFFIFLVLLRRFPGSGPVPARLAPIPGDEKTGASHVPPATREGRRRVALLWAAPIARGNRAATYQSENPC